MSRNILVQYFFKYGGCALSQRWKSKMRLLFCQFELKCETIRKYWVFQSCLIFMGFWSIKFHFGFVRLWEEVNWYDCKKRLVVLLPCLFHAPSISVVWDNDAWKYLDFTGVCFFFLAPVSCPCMWVSLSDATIRIRAFKGLKLLKRENR